MSTPGVQFVQSLASDRLIQATLAAFESFHFQFAEKIRLVSPKLSTRKSRSSLFKAEEARRDRNPEALIDV
jgi:hypothetical protein